MGVGTVLKMKVRMTDACGHGPDQNLTGSWVAMLNVLDFKRFVYFSENGSLHSDPLA
tara:strand:- start:7523 stop:7693 length:171 start_codon:yes stop_codon:yes gene_type:complete